MAHLAHYKEAHPLPFRITHWVNLLAMLLLIVSGFIIHYPAGLDHMGIARGVHIFCGFVLLANCLVRVALAFVVKSAPAGGTREVVPDYKTWLPQADNRHQGIQWIKYYLFLKKDHPLSAKLGVPQKISYLAICPLIIVMFITGLCIWAPVMDAAPLAALTSLVGGQMHMRIVHYFLMFVFICFTLLHAYLANIEGFAPTKLMFFGKEHGGLTYDMKTHNISGYDDLGEGEKH